MVCPNRTTPRQFSGNVTSGSIIALCSWMPIQDVRTATAPSFITAPFKIPGVEIPGGITSGSHQCCRRIRYLTANDLPLSGVLAIF